MTNIEALKERLSDNDPISLDLLEEILNEFEDKVIRIKELEDELEEANDEIDNLKNQETEYENSIDLGLDTIHFTFEKGNLLIRQQFNDLMQVLNKTPNAVI